jgi:hypothetical protein
VGSVVEFFFHFVEVLFSFFSIFYGKEGSKKSASFDFGDFIGERLVNGGIGEFLHFIIFCQNRRESLLVRRYFV